MEYRYLQIAKVGGGSATAFAQEELCRYLKSMDAHLMIDLEEWETYIPGKENILWIGLCPEFPVEVPKVEEPKFDDGIVVSVKGTEGIITGTNDGSVLIGAYRFLKAMGFDFVAPGPEGDRIPRQPFAWQEISICETPSYRHRGVCIEGADTYENIADMVDFLPKVGMNEYYIQFLVPFEFFRRWRQHDNNPLLKKAPISREEVEGITRRLEKDIKKRGLRYHKTGHGWTCEPFGIDGSGWHRVDESTVSEEARGYLAEVGGKRELWDGVPLNTNLCYSNPVVRGKMTDAMTAYCKQNPQVDILHFWLADGFNNHCECENCRKKRPADWYVTMLNELDEKLTKEKIDTKIVFLIYVDLLWEPETERILHPERFILMFAPITRVYGEDYHESLEYHGTLPPYVRNELEMPKSLDQNLEHLRRWQKQFQGDSFDYDYHLMWAHIMDPGYEYCAKNLHGDMHDLQIIGINGMSSCQVSRSFFPTGLPFISMAATLWDREVSFNQVANQYYLSAFGEDGPAVREIMKELSGEFILYHNGAHGSISEVKTRKGEIDLELLLSAYQGLLEEHTPSFDANVEKAWEYLEMHLEYVKGFIRATKAMEEKDAPALKEAVESFCHFIQSHELELQKVLDVNNTINTLGRAVKLISE